MRYCGSASGRAAGVVAVSVVSLMSSCRLVFGFRFFESAQQDFDAESWGNVTLNGLPRLATGAKPRHHFVERVARRARAPTEYRGAGVRAALGAQEIAIPEPARLDHGLGRLAIAADGLADLKRRAGVVALRLPEPFQGPLALGAVASRQKRDGAFRYHGPEAYDLAAREHGGRHGAELLQDEDDHRAGGWLLESLEESLGRRPRHGLGLVDDEDLPRRLRGPQRGQPAQLADVLHADRLRALGIALGRRGLDQPHVGMHPARDPRLRSRAHQGRGKGERRRFSAHALRPDE